MCCGFSLGIDSVLSVVLVLQEKCHQYWPAERSARYQYFVVDPMAEYNMPQYILREFKVTNVRVGLPNCYCVRQEQENALTRLVLAEKVTRQHVHCYSPTL